MGGGRFGEGDEREEEEEEEEKGRDLPVMPLYMIMTGRKDFVSLSRYAEQAALPGGVFLGGGMKGESETAKRG